MKTLIRIPVVLAGEKDHGKSTLIGRLLYETGSIPADRIETIRETAIKAGRHFEWAHLLDSLKYERRREMTLDTTRAAIQLGNRIYEFIDVPGHEKLIKNMATGASSARYAILVIAADGGVTPRTIQHAEILKFLGAEKIIIAVTKCDLVSYSEKKFKEIARSAAERLLKPKLVYKDVLPTASFVGDNLVQRTKRLSWFRGPTLVHAIKKEFVPLKNPEKTMPLIMVQDVYPKNLIIGTLFAGTLSNKSSVYIFPQKSRHVIKRLFVNAKAKSGAAEGDSIGLGLSPHPQSIRRGDIISTEKSIKTENIIHANCLLFKIPGRKNLVLENKLQSVPISAIHWIKKPKIGLITPAIIKLRRNAFLPERFVFKENSKIIGAGINL